MRRKVWAEDREGMNVSGEHMTADLDLDSLENVRAKPVKAGMLILTQCSKCGRQAMNIVKWAEVACWILGRPVENCEGKRDGMHLYWACSRCPGHANEICFSWTEVKGFVDEGVGGQALKPTIYRAAGLT